MEHKRRPSLRSQNIYAQAPPTPVLEIFLLPIQMHCWHFSTVVRTLGSVLCGWWQQTSWPSGFSVYDWKQTRGRVRRSLCLSLFPCDVTLHWLKLLLKLIRQVIRSYYPSLKVTNLSSGNNSSLSLLGFSYLSLAVLRCWGYFLFLPCWFSLANTLGKRTLINFS